MADAPTRARKMTDRMTKQLGLDQATSQKVYDATLARDQKIDDIRANSTDNRANAKAMKANADDYKSKLQGILTPDQFAKAEAMRGKGRRNQGGNGADNNDQNTTTKPSEHYAAKWDNLPDLIIGRLSHFAAL